MIIAPKILYGIDKQINLIQRYLDDKIWGVWNNRVMIYGRTYSIEINEKKTLCVFTEGNDYKLIFLDDSVNVAIAFRVNNRTIDENRLKASIDIIFAINVKESEGSAYYLDEKVFLNAHRIVSACGFIENITDIKIGIDDVFAGFDTESLKHSDMSPFHIFSFTTQIEYSNNICE